MVQCSHGKQEALGSSLSQATFFFRPCDIRWLVGGGGPALAASSKMGLSHRFRADSGSYLIRQGEM